jgi:transcriptional regulator with XRE-family HTH domain
VPLESLRSKLESRGRLPEPSVRRALREGARATQLDVAEAIGELVDGSPPTRATVSRWESGARTPRGRLLDAYVVVLDELRRGA